MMSDRQPSLDTLQAFARRYFSARSVPTVRWKKMDVLGMADCAKRTIYLNPDAMHCQFGCAVGNGMVFKLSTRMKLSAWEGYFLTLLHEIAHFKYRRWKIPEPWKRLKRKLRREYPGNVEMQTYTAEDYRDRFADEMEMEDFIHYVGGGAAAVPSLHIKVEDWAVQEFKKRRKAIGALRRIS